jgi:hypothetical protein
MMSARLSPYIAPAEDHADMLWRCCNVLVLAFEWLMQQQVVPQGAGDVCICSLSLITFAYFMWLVNPARLWKSISVFLQDAHFQLTVFPRMKSYTATEIKEMEGDGKLKQYSRFLWDKWKPDQLFCLVSLFPKRCVQSVIEAHAKKVDISDCSMVLTNNDDSTATPRDHGAAISNFVELLVAADPSSVQSLCVTPDTPLPCQKMLRSKRVDLAGIGSLKTMDAIAVVALIKYNVSARLYFASLFKRDCPLFQFRTVYRTSLSGAMAMIVSLSSWRPQ